MNSTPDRLRVLSMNLANGRADVSGIAALLESLEPDVVVVQELVPRQAELLGSLFPFGKLDPGSDDTGMGIALRHPASTWRLPMPFRDAYVAEILLPAWTAYGDGVQIINVHLAAPHIWPPGRTLARRRGQLQALEAHLDTGCRPRLVVGDLNSTPMWPAYRRLRFRLADAAMEAARRSGARPLPTWGPAPGALQLLRIDHALVQGLGVGGVEVHRIPGSDHSALLVEIIPDGGDACEGQ
jgi:endonuclease/exonuclease/phosphatase (EEP) superfamily protein YafD